MAASGEKNSSQKKPSSSKPKSKKPSSPSGAGTQKRSSAKTAPAGKKPAGKPMTAAQARKRAKAIAELQRQRKRFICAIILFFLAVFFTFVFFMPGEKFWLSIHELYLGIFGVFGFMIPVILAYCSYQNFRDDYTPKFRAKVILLSIDTILLASTVFCFSAGEDPLKGYADELHNSLIYSSTHTGPGVIGAMLGIPFVKFIGQTGGGVVSVLLLLVFIALTFGDFTIKMINAFKSPVKELGEHMSDKKEIRTQVRKKQQENRAKQRQQSREEYVRTQVDKKLSQKNKQKDSQFRRYRKTPFYEADKIVPEQAQDQPAPEMTTPAPMPVQSSQPAPEMVQNPAAEKKKKKKPAKNTNSFPDDFFTDTGDFDLSELDVIPENDIPEDHVDLENASFFEPEPKTKPRSKKKGSKQSEEFVLTPDNSYINGRYLKPPTTLLEPQPYEDGKNISAELNQGGTMLVEVLKSFGVQTSIVNISRGPSITRYELQPASGVKISKITNLSDDIAMNLAAIGVRIEAPIPGKSAVGIEVPNKHRTIVKMRDLIESDEFINAKSNLTVALGRDISGGLVLADLSRMPHLLIAGSTGSGKSVCINTMLISLIYKSSPDDVKLMLIDPKVVELGVYNGIPHLLVPVVTDPRKAAGALNWAVNEMLKRYNTFAKHNVRDMRSYNRFVERENAQNHDAFQNETAIDDTERTFEEDEMLAQAQAELDPDEIITPEEPKKLEKMPQIVIVIDELADLMMAAPNEVEESICRLAQMARAAGMHLVIATQRPSVDVITGLIKANVPSRIAFAVKSAVDSRTILDSGGAEKLIGRGDMLFSPIGTIKPVRVQGGFVDDTEVERVIEFIKQNQAVEYDDMVLEQIENAALPEKGGKDGGDADGDTDPMIEEAIRCVVEAGQASTSMLQRRFRIGYARAGRLIDEMEQMGVVGPHEGSKPRQVLMTYQQFLERSVTKADTVTEAPLEE